MHDDRYFYRRAEAELAMAERSTDRDAVRIHYQLANLYLERVEEAGTMREVAGRR